MNQRCAKRQRKPELGAFFRWLKKNILSRSDTDFVGCMVDYVVRRSFDRRPRVRRRSGQTTRAPTTPAALAALAARAAPAAPAGDTVVVEVVKPVEPTAEPVEPAPVLGICSVHNFRIVNVPWNGLRKRVVDKSVFDLHLLAIAEISNVHHPSGDSGPPPARPSQLLVQPVANLICRT